MPNQLNKTSKGYFCLYRITISFLSHTHIGFVKMQTPTGYGENRIWFLLIQLVWRLSEFAFWCGYFGSRTFYLGGTNEKS